MTVVRPCNMIGRLLFLLPSARGVLEHFGARSRIMNTKNPQCLAGKPEERVEDATLQLGEVILARVRALSEQIAERCRLVVGAPEPSNRDEGWLGLKTSFSK
jgi:hypothetical protein